MTALQNKLLRPRRPNSVKLFYILVTDSIHDVIKTLDAHGVFLGQIVASHLLGIVEMANLPDLILGSGCSPIGCTRKVNPTPALLHVAYIITFRPCDEVFRIHTIPYIAQVPD